VTTVGLWEVPCVQVLRTAAVHRTAVVRLGAHLNSGVRVPDLADTVGPVTESNCAGPYPRVESN